MELFKEISAQEAKELMNRENTKVIDIRDPLAYEEGHIDQAVKLDEQTIDQFLTKTDKEIHLICYCYHGFSSRSAAEFFSHKGFKNVYSLKGGYEQWKNFFPNQIKYN